MKKALFIAAVILILFATTPWFTPTKVEGIINKRSNSLWAGVADGCGPIEEFKDTHRVIFGFTSSIRYGCGMVKNEEDLKGTWHFVYVSPFGTVHGDDFR